MDRDLEKNKLRLLVQVTPPTTSYASVLQDADRYYCCSPQIEEELNVGGLKRLSQPTFKENSAQYHGPDGNTFSRFCLWFI